MLVDYGLGKSVHGYIKRGGDRMRLIARLPDQDQVGALVDSLKNAGFDRNDMIISDMDKVAKSSKESLKEDILVQTELESIRVGQTGTYVDSIEGLQGRTGIIVAVELPKHSGDKVRSIMEQSGAIEIIQD